MTIRQYYQSTQQLPEAYQLLISGNFDLILLDPVDPR